MKGREPAAATSLLLLTREGRVSSIQRWLGIMEAEHAPTGPFRRAGAFNDLLMSPNFNDDGIISSHEVTANAFGMSSDTTGLFGIYTG